MHVHVRDVSAKHDQILHTWPPPGSSPRRGGGWRRSALPGLEDCIPPATTPQSEAEAEAAHTSWDSISGLETVKRLLQEATVLPTLRPDLFTVRACSHWVLSDEKF